MKKCNECNIEMCKGEVNAQHIFEVGEDGNSEIYVYFKNGKKEVKTLLGKVKEKDNFCEELLKCYVCPKCGKVDFYIDGKKDE